jgi:hypothetical protein
MPQVALKLVHNRPFVGQADDLAAALLFSIAGLIVHLVVITTAFVGS